MNIRPSIFLNFIMGICLVESCSLMWPSGEGMELASAKDSCCIFADSSVEIRIQEDDIHKDIIYSVLENNDIAKYHYLGEIKKGADSIQFVRLSIYFNITESTRCNSKILIYRNKLLVGYYLVPCEDFVFRITDNKLECVPTANHSCITFLDFDPYKPRDLYLQYADDTRDIITFERFNANTYNNYLPFTLMFTE